MLTKIKFLFSRQMPAFLLFFLAFTSQDVLSGSFLSTDPYHGMVKVEGGPFTPFYNVNKDGKAVPNVIVDFYMDEAPVTNVEFYAFIQKEPRWSKEHIKRIFAEPSYLRHWDDDSDQSQTNKTLTLLNKQPVRFVSWFAASAYCEHAGKELPSILQWEYVASADEESKDATLKESYRQKILLWYGRPSAQRLPDVKSGRPNFFGVYDLHGMVWEWNLDYNTAMVTGESRENTSLNRAFFCGSGSLGAKNSLDYGAFMRFGFRSSLKGNYTIGNLGFRCVINSEVKP